MTQMIIAARPIFISVTMVAPLAHSTMRLSRGSSINLADFIPEPEAPDATIYFCALSLRMRILRRPCGGLSIAAAGHHGRHSHRWHGRGSSGAHDCQDRKRSSRGGRSNLLENTDGRGEDRRNWPFSRSRFFRQQRTLDVVLPAGAARYSGKLCGST